MNISDDLFGNGAAGSRQRHQNVRGLIGREVDFVDEPKIINVERNFWILDGAEGRYHGGSQGCLIARPWRHTWILQDKHVGSARRNRMLRNRIFSVENTERAPGMGRAFFHGHSVEATSSLASSALFKVCQGNVAHLTRMG